jgi:hypothetical protein
VHHSGNVQCGSQACVNPTQCQQYSNIASANTVASVCFTSKDVAACGNPNGGGVTCDQYVVGWSGAQCMQYTVASSGHCDATGTCINTCANVPAQIEQPVTGGQGCANVNCTKSTACQAGQAASLYSCV